MAEALEIDGRMVISNMCVETGAKTAVFSTPDERSDNDASYASEMYIDCSNLEPIVALPHDPANGVPVSDAAGTAVDWVFLGTCCGGSAGNFRNSARILETHGGIARGVTVVVTPQSRSIRAILETDGTLSRLRSLGAIVTETGCGPCCGTSAPIPPPNARVLSTANRNFLGRMGEPSALIYLASPLTCAAAAVHGQIVDPRELM
jgi:3-isopropylmalate/(R)-2-methylmalate dehydratase large subunit